MYYKRIRDLREDKDLTQIERTDDKTDYTKKKRR